MNLLGNWKLAPDEVLLIEVKPRCSAVRRTELVAT